MPKIMPKKIMPKKPRRPHFFTKEMKQELWQKAGQEGEAPKTQIAKTIEEGTKRRSNRKNRHSENTYRANETTC